jgi:hypothetical protein
MTTKKQRTIFLNPALWALLAVGLLLPGTSSAKLCIGFGAADIVGPTASIPKKNSCKPFNGYVENEPGNLVTGTLCTSGDDSTVVGNLYFGVAGPEDAAFSLPKNGLSSSNGKDCTGFNDCSTGVPVDVVTCSKPTVPDSVTAPARSGKLTSEP